MSHHDDLYGEMEANGRGTGAPSRPQGDIADSDSERRNYDSYTNAPESKNSGSDIPVEEDDLGADTRCFVVKPDSYRDIEQSHEERLLYPPGYILDRIRGACRGGPVALVFSVNGSRAFQGYATVDPKEVERNSSARSVPVAWQRVTSLSHNSTGDIVNKYNGNQPVKTSRDGQELEISCASRLIKLLRNSPEETLESLKETLKEVEAFPGFNAHGPYSSGDAASEAGEIRRPADMPSYKPGEHPALLGLDLRDMSYDEYLVQYRLRQDLARDQFHASLAARAVAAGGPPPMGMMGGHGGPGPMGMHGHGPSGFFHGGPGMGAPGMGAPGMGGPPYGMSGPNMYPPRMQYGGMGYGGGRGGYHNNGGGGRWGGRGGRGY